MQFTHKPLPTYPEVTRLEDKSGYQTPIGILPSVTTVLSATADKSLIEAWQKRIGFEAAEAIRLQAGVRGENSHLAIYNYLKNKDISEDIITNPHGVRYLNQMRMTLNLHVDNIVCQETPFYSPILQTAGMIDCSADYDKLWSIIDFKTALRTKKPEWIHEYSVQVAVYWHMLMEWLNFLWKAGLISPKADPVQTAIILVSENDFGCQVFLEDRVEKLVELVDEFRQRRKDYGKLEHTKR